MISILYVSVLGLLYVAMSLQVAGMRFRARLAFGDGGNPQMIKIVRAHGNFGEYVPFALLLLFLLDYERHIFWIIHTLGILLVAARICHLIGIQKGILRLRMAGMIMTMAMMVISSLLLLWHYFAVQLTGF